MTHSRLLQVITALGKIWHTEHFCCNGCQEELGTRSFFERDEMPYCEPCYHRLFAPLCGKCNDPILDVSSDIIFIVSYRPPGSYLHLLNHCFPVNAEMCHGNGLDMAYGMLHL